MKLLLALLLVVTRVISAHHGTCPAATNRIYAARAATLFARPQPYTLYNCMALTESAILDKGCGGAAATRNTLFIMLRHPQTVVFTEHRYSETARIERFGVALQPDGKSTEMYYPVAAFPNPSPPPGTRRYNGPSLYGGFAVDGDPFGLARGECSGV